MGVYSSLKLVSEYFDFWVGAAGCEFRMKLGLDMRQKVVYYDSVVIDIQIVHSNHGRLDSG